MEIIIPKIFNAYLKDRKATLLAIGPMSKNCVEATIEIANEKKVPIMVSAQFNQKNFTSSKGLVEPYKRTISRLFELTSPNFNANKS